MIRFIIVSIAVRVQLKRHPPTEAQLEAAYLAICDALQF